MSVGKRRIPSEKCVKIIALHGKNDYNSEMNLVQKDGGEISVFLFCAAYGGQGLEEEMNKGMKRAVVAGLAACLTMTSLAGCSKEEAVDWTKAAITVDGEEIEAGLVKFMVHYTQAASESFYSAYYGSGVFNMALDENGTTLGSLVVDGSVEEAKQLVLAEQHAEEYGISLTDEEKAAITEAATAFMEANEAEVLEKMNATQEIVERYLELYTIQDKVEVEMGADVDTEVSDEEAAQRRIQYVYFTAASEKAAAEEAETETEAATEEVTEAAETEAVTEEATEAAETEAAETEAVTEEVTEAETAALTEEEEKKTQSADETETEAVTEEVETETEDPETVEAMAKALAKAEAVIANIQAGDDFETALAAVDENKSALEMTFGSDDETVYDGLIEATEGLADGTLVETPIETDYGYYVVQVVSELDREATDARKEEIVEERRSDLVSELYTEWEEAVEVTQDDEIIGKIVFDFSLALETEAAAEAETEEVTEAATEEVAETETEA